MSILFIAISQDLTQQLLRKPVGWDNSGPSSPGEEQLKPSHIWQCILLFTSCAILDTKGPVTSMPLCQPLSPSCQLLPHCQDQDKSTPEMLLILQHKYIQATFYGEETFLLSHLKKHTHTHTHTGKRDTRAWVFSLKCLQRTSLVVQWLRLQAHTAEGRSVSPGRGTKIPYA